MHYTFLVVIKFSVGNSKYTANNILGKDKRLNLPKIPKFLKMTTKISHNNWQQKMTKPRNIVKNDEIYLKIYIFENLPYFQLNLEYTAK